MDTNTDVTQVTKVYPVLQEYPWAGYSRVIDVFRTQKAAEDCARELSPVGIARNTRKMGYSSCMYRRKGRKKREGS